MTVSMHKHLSHLDAEIKHTTLLSVPTMSRRETMHTSTALFLRETPYTPRTALTGPYMDGHKTNNTPLKSTC